MFLFPLCQISVGQLIVRILFRLIDDGHVSAVDLATGVYAALSRWGANRLRYFDQSVNGELWVHLAAPLPTLQDARARAAESMEALPEPYHTLIDPPLYPVLRSAALQQLRDEARSQLRGG